MSFQVPSPSRHFEATEEDGQDRRSESLSERTLIEMTAQIVAAYLSRNAIPAAEVPQVIAAVRQGLAGLASEPEADRSDKPEPAVPIKGSVGRDAIACLICGRRQKMLKRHILIAHGLNPAEYRQTFGLRSDYPMTAPSYAKKRSQLARQFGLGVRGKRS
jgi:predicted transcriptional regulator